MRSLKLLDYLPKPKTPGFDLASPRAFQVLVALLQHASQQSNPPDPSGQSPSKTASSAKSKPSQSSTGTKQPEAAGPANSKPTPKKKRRPAKRSRPSKRKPPDCGSPQASAVQAVWTVEEIASVCGCNRNTAGAALKELVALGWIEKAIGRTKGGEYSGFWYALLIPPSELTPTAEHFYTTKVDQTEDRLLQVRKRITNSTTPNERPDDSKPTSAPAPAVDEPSSVDGPDKEEAI